MTENAPERAPATATEDTTESETTAQKSEQMCCDGNRTAAEHRSQSADGKCCSD